MVVILSKPGRKHPALRMKGMPTKIRCSGSTLLAQGKALVASDATIYGLSGPHLLWSLVEADTVEKLFRAFHAQIALDQVFDFKLLKRLDEIT